MAFTPEQLQALAHNLGDLSAALAEFEEATPGSTLMTAGEAAAALGVDDIDTILAARPELAGLALPRFVVQLSNLSDELEEAAVTAALAIYLIVPKIPRLAHYAVGWRTGMLELLYYALPHLELFDLRRRVLHGYGPVSANVMATLVAYGAVWTGVLLLIAWLAYRQRHFQRDRMLE